MKCLTMAGTRKQKLKLRLDGKDPDELNKFVTESSEKALCPSVTMWIMGWIIHVRS